ncbi:hypothetical protein OJ967_11540 [Peribacillus frigoritolerans]|uniref:hypothetical protein n=1 Tax=Peribacillus frigoritolerans TaxID=450367 RepID=UPI002226BEB3|nr:hypothetical protein [Peribacillus frigoritolerans]UYZ01066.1 hypothetical protein OJ967_11540 [Peribacillus frigoritolerans]
MSRFTKSGEWDIGIFIKVKHWFQKANETDGILDVSSEQMKLQVNIIDLTEYDNSAGS